MDYRVVFEITESAPLGQIFVTLLRKKMIAVMLSFWCRSCELRVATLSLHLVCLWVVTRYWTSLYHGICNSCVKFYHLASVVQVTVIPSYSICMQYLYWLEDLYKDWLCLPLLLYLIPILHDALFTLTSHESLASYVVNMFRCSVAKTEIKG